MELCPELVAKPTKDKMLVCNFQQQVCVLIRTDSWVRRLELACHAVAVPTTGANGRKMSHSQRRIRLAATRYFGSHITWDKTTQHWPVWVKQAAGGKTQSSGAHSREGAAVMAAGKDIQGCRGTVSLGHVLSQPEPTLLHYHRQPDCLTHAVQNGCKTECILGTQVKRILWSVETVLRD